ncbi:LysR family transcriptional regulator [Oceanospirillum sediminis]|uniref:LysR family transcriptional regulator n=1 Tax=Oceanospirillum sediminis TaxID=2760088 RepID=A0A839IPM3_9GAMM|nr:LysR family transcriptional regulator [Oceanospirillum sediminis]MBB1486881.1 LysR family transcriptional regulator [Oceanospirillum sediminis]
MDIKRLKYFCALAQIGNFTHTATHLGIAQPALSMAIKKLEEEVGLKLVNRAERKMTLTSDGEVLLRHAQRILNTVSEAELEIQELKGFETGTIQFGASSMLSSYYLPEMLASFKKQYPKVRVNLIEAGTASLQQMLLEGELDIALIRSDRPHEQIRCVELFQEEVAACVPQDHPLSQQQEITLETFCREPLVLYREGYFLREAVSKYSRQHHIKLDIRFETNLIDLLKSLVENEVGISTVLSRIVTEKDKLTTIPFTPRIPLYIGLGWKKNHYLSKASRAFVDFMQNNLPEGLDLALPVNQIETFS